MLSPQLFVKVTLKTTGIDIYQHLRHRLYAPTPIKTTLPSQATLVFSDSPVLIIVKSWDPLVPLKGDILITSWLNSVFALYAILGANLVQSVILAWGNIWYYSGKLACHVQRISNYAKYEYMTSVLQVLITFWGNKDWGDSSKKYELQELLFVVTSVNQILSSHGKLCKISSQIYIINHVQT